MYILYKVGDEYSILNESEIFAIHMNETSEVVVVETRTFSTGVKCDNIWAFESIADAVEVSKRFTDIGLKVKGK